MGEGTVDFLVVFEGDSDEYGAGEDTKSGEWYWRGLSDNGEIVTRGEDHPNYSNALRAARGAHPNRPVFKIVDGEKVPVGVHATDRHSEIKAMLGIPDSEPIFILRAQDQLAAKAIRSYRGHARNEVMDAEDAYLDDHDGEDVPDDWKGPIPEEWFNEITQEEERFLAWQKENPDKVKLPD